MLKLRTWQGNAQISNLFEMCPKPEVIKSDYAKLCLFTPDHFTIFAEKLETVLSKGAINSRMKDYHDLFLLARNSTLIQLKILEEAIQSTFKNRGTRFELIKFDAEEFKPLQRYRSAHLRDLGKIAQDLNLPQKISDTIQEINSYLSKMK